MNASYEIIVVITSVISGILSLFLSRKLFNVKTYTPENAIELIRNGKPEVWNEVRIKYPTWFPNLANLSFSNLNLSNINLSSLNLAEVNFENILFNNANFDNSNLANSNFQDCKIIDSSFRRANVGNSRFLSCIINSSFFIKANLSMSEFIESEVDNSIFLDCLLEGTIGLFESNNREEIVDYDSIKNTNRNAIELLQNISEYELENLMKEYFKVNGYKVSHNIDSFDVGFDFLIEKEEIWGTNKIAVEIKKMSSNKKIHSNTIQGLHGLVNIRKLDKVIFITTGTLSDEAEQLLSQSNQIVIMNEAKIISILNKILRGDSNT